MSKQSAKNELKDLVSGSIKNEIKALLWWDSNYIVFRNSKRFNVNSEEVVKILTENPDLIPFVLKLNDRDYDSKTETRIGEKPDETVPKELEGRANVRIVTFNGSITPERAIDEFETFAVKYNLPDCCDFLGV